MKLICKWLPGLFLVLIVGAAHGQVLSSEPIRRNF